MARIITEINKIRTEDFCAVCGDSIEKDSLVVRVSNFEFFEWIHRKIHPDCYGPLSVSIWEDSINSKGKPKAKRGRPALGFTEEQNKARASFSSQFGKDQESIVSAYTLDKPDKTKSLWLRIGRRLSSINTESHGDPLPKVNFDEKVVKLIEEKDYKFWFEVFQEIKNVKTGDPEYLKNWYAPDPVPDPGDPIWIGKLILGAVEKVYGDE